MRQYVEWDHSEGLSAIASRTLYHVMSLQIEQRGKQPQLNQTPSTPHQFYVTVRSSLICSVTILLHTAAQAKSTNIARLRLTYSKYKEMRWDDVLITRLRLGHHLSLKAHHYQIDQETDPTCPYVSKQNIG